MGKSDAACKGCGVQIIFQDGQESVKCEYCGLVNFAPKTEEPIKSNVIPGPQSGANTSEADALIRRAYLLLEEGDFAHADNCLEQALNLYPENAAAYIGKLMVEACAQKENELGKSSVSLDRYNNYKNALQFASPEQKERLEGYNRQIADRKSREFADFQRQIAYETEISNQKAAKAKKIWIVIGAVVAAIIVLASISSVSSGFAEKQKKYDNAAEYAAQGDYAHALQLFTQLNGYRDASEQINTLAEKAYAEGDIAVAARAWRTNGNIQKMNLFSVLITAGKDHYAGLMSDGTVLAAGNNQFGQCDVADWKNIQALSSGTGFTVGLVSDGSVVATGNNDYGQCNVQGWTDIRQIASGPYCTVGLKSDGTVVATGMNDHGECNVAEWTDIVYIAAGGEQTLGVTTNGSVVSTGTEDTSQLGYNIVSVASAYGQSLALSSNGNQTSVGPNAHQSNSGKDAAIAAKYNTVLKLAKEGYAYCVSGALIITGSQWEDIIAIAPGDGLAIGLKEDGSVVLAEKNTSETKTVTVQDWKLF